MSSGPDRDADALAAAVAVACRLGFSVSAPRILQSRTRLTPHLLPAPIVARVAAVADLMRQETDVRVARHVCGRGGPAIPPLSAPVAGPHREGAFAVSLWRFVPEGPPPRDVDAAAAEAYVGLRTALDAFDGPLPSLWELPDACEAELESKRPALLSPPDHELLRTTFSAARAELDRSGFPEIALHGDPHLGNLLHGAARSVWLDFESACRGPLEWDLTALPSTPGGLPHHPRRLAALRRLRSAWVVVWCASRSSPDAVEREAIGFHLGELRSGR